MSTRATYTTIDKPFGGKKTRKTHFYIHYDGYSEGAAGYFHQLFNLKNKRGGMAEQFLRANDLAEFTDDPKNHGDTEYHYNLKVNGDLEQVVFYYDDEDNRKTKSNYFKVWDFVNSYGQFEPTDYPLTWIETIGDRVNVMTTKGFFDEAMTAIAQVIRHPQGVGNNSHNLDRAFKFLALIVTAYDELAEKSKIFNDGLSDLARSYLKVVAILQPMNDRLFGLSGEERDQAVAEFVEAVKMLDAITKKESSEEKDQGDDQNNDQGGASVSLNEEKQGIEIKFQSKPADSIRQKLKDLGFRWSKKLGFWFAKQTEERINFAKALSVFDSSVYH